MSEDSSYWKEVDPPMSFIPEGWTYEQKRKFRYMILDYLHDEMDLEAWEGKRVLCIGDGAGIDALEFARHGARVDVVDMSEKAVELTLKHRDEARAAGHKIDLAATVCDVTSEKFSHGILSDKNKYDLIYSFGVLHHLSDYDLIRVLSLLGKLKSGTTLMGMVYNRDSLLYAYSILLRAQKNNITPNLAMRLYAERNPNVPYAEAFTINEWNWLLKNAGFVVNENTTRPFYNVVDLPEKRKVTYTPSRELAHLGWHLFFKVVTQ